MGEPNSTTSNTSSVHTADSRQPEQQTPTPQPPKVKPLWENLFLKASTKQRQFATHQIGIRFKMWDAGTEEYYDEAIVLLFNSSMADEFEKLTDSTVESTARLYVVHHFTVNHIRPSNIDVNIRTYKAKADQYHIEYPQNVNPAKLSANFKQKFGVTKSQRDHYRQVLDNIFSHDFLGIIEKITNLKHRDRFWAGFRQQCHSGTDDFLEHYGQDPGTIEIIHRMLSNLGNPPLRSIRMNTLAKLQADESYRNALVTHVASLRQLIENNAPELASRMPSVPVYREPEA